MLDNYRISYEMIGVTYSSVSYLIAINILSLNANVVITIGLIAATALIIQPSKPDKTSEYISKNGDSNE